MKKSVFLIGLACAACAGLPSAEGDATIVVDIFNPYQSPSSAKSGISVPETGDFILTVTDASGACMYHGRFADSPEAFSVREGVYTVSAVSREFDIPAYDEPQLGDSRTVSVESGGRVGVSLMCSQLNSGLQLNVSPEFRSMFPRATLYMKGTGGTLMYSYGEERTAYFNPGPVSLSMVESSVEKPLLTRVLDPRQVLRVNLTASDNAAGTDAVRLTVDTSRVWVTEDFCYGSGSGVQAMSVSEAMRHVGEKGVWVYGYVVGSCPSSSKIETAPPFTRNTNIVIASRTGVSDKTSCIAVELPSGDVRNGLNLVDNPSGLGRMVLLKGNLVESYYSMTGLKSTSVYEWR